MAPKLLKELKEVSFSCTSPASASTNTSSDDQQSMLTSARIGGRAIDRCSPHLRDPLRAKSLNPVLSQPPTSKPKNFNSSSSKAKSASEKKPVELISPASSRRYLLSDESTSADFLQPDHHASFIIVKDVSRFQSLKIEEPVILRPFESSRIENLKVEEANDAKPCSSSSSASAKPLAQQV